MTTHSSRDRFQRRTKSLAAAKARLREQLAAQVANAVQNRADSASGGQGAASGNR